MNGLSIQVDGIRWQLEDAKDRLESLADAFRDVFIPDAADSAEEAVTAIDAALGALGDIWLET